MSINIKVTTTPNCEERTLKYKPDLIVCHITEGKYAGAISWLKNPDSEASANYVLSRTGEITQMVDPSKAAWANGTSTKSDKKYYYKRATNKYVKERGGNANDYSVSIETEGFSETTGGALTDLQLAALIELIQHIRVEIKRLYGNDIPIDRDHIIGHYEIAPKEKPNCPGKLFPWDKVIDGVKRAAGQTVDTTYPIPATPQPDAGTDEEFDESLFKAGRKIIIKDVEVYGTSNSTTGVKKSGTYWIYDGKEINGMYRITNGASRVGKTPIGSNVSGYIKKLAVPTVTPDTDTVNIINDIQHEDLYAVGRAVKFTNAALYAASTGTKSSKKLNGTYYIYDGKEVDGRYRITNDKHRVAQTPLSANVTGYVNRSTIK